jgi:hypothetical protein
MELGVYCECGKCVSLAESDAGSALTCSCGRRVVVPLLEEFRDHPVLLSAATVERRVRRLIAEGVLPNTDACLRCGHATARPVAIDLQCERYVAHTSGGQRFLIIPLLWGFLWATWQEPERVEIRGRDVDVPAPVSLCAACRRRLRAPAAKWSLLLAAILLATSAVVGFFHLVSGIGLVLGGVALLIVTRRLARRRWQGALKVLLRKVPVYRQVLERFPSAVVLMPRDGSDRE